MYNIEILSDQEFEALPYPETETSLGIADPETNTAYIRYTQSDEVNKYLINHELEHLIEGHGGTHSDHYRNGVYYKGFGEILQNILPTVAGFFTGGPVGAGLGAAGSLANNRAQAAQKKAFAQQGQGFSGSGSSFSGQQSVTFPSQSSFQATPAPPSIGTSQGASGGTGALGQSPMGSPVDKIRPLLGSQNNQDELGGFPKGFYAGRLR